MWIGNHDGKFSVRSAYDVLQTYHLEPEKEIFKLVLSSLVPSMINTFAWRIMLDRPQTKAIFWSTIALIKKVIQTVSYVLLVLKRHLTFSFHAQYHIRCDLSVILG